MNSETTSARTTENNADLLPQQWGWLLALGVLMLISGTIGMYMSFWVTLATVMLFGGFAIVGGALQMVEGIAVREEKWIGRLQHFAIALLYLALGVVIFLNPVGASAGLTLAIAGLFMAIGITRIAWGLQCRKKEGSWVAHVIFGLVNLLLAGLIIMQWPVSGLWVIGMLVSIELIFNGWLMVVTALAAKKAQSAKA